MLFSVRLKVIFIFFNFFFLLQGQSFGADDLGPLKSYFKVDEIRLK
jgi:hypothetical protein